MRFKLYLNLRENMAQQKPVTNENGPSASAVYKRTVWTADSTGLREGNGGGW